MLQVYYTFQRSLSGCGRWDETFVTVCEFFQAIGDAEEEVEERQRQAEAAKQQWEQAKVRLREQKTANQGTPPLLSYTILSSCAISTYCIFKLTTQFRAILIMDKNS